MEWLPTGRVRRAATPAGLVVEGAAIAAMVPELSTRRVLTSQYVDAMRWAAALEQPQSLRDQWGQTMARFQWLSLFRHGITNLEGYAGHVPFSS